MAKEELLSKKDWERIDDLVDNHNYSIAEAKQMVLDDKAIDKGQKMDFDLTDAEAKAAIKNAHKNQERKSPTSTKTRKEDTVKRQFIAEIATFLAENWAKTIENVSIDNPERIISFNFDGDKYEIVLQKKRK